jgi:hypothetical protein
MIVYGLILLQHKLAAAVFTHHDLRVILHGFQLPSAGRAF